MVDIDTYITPKNSPQTYSSPFLISKIFNDSLQWLIVYARFPHAGQLPVTSVSARCYVWMETNVFDAETAAITGTFTADIHGPLKRLPPAKSINR